MPSYRRLQQYAIAISFVSVIYNGLEGGLSIGFGAESKSRALISYGIQSGIEVISALFVIWRFRNIAKPGEERGANLNPENLRFEKLGTIAIGILLIALALGTVASSIAILVLHQEPDASNASLIISASAIIIMILIWLPKRYLATSLDSSTMRGEAICSLSCIQLTCVLFAGSLTLGRRSDVDGPEHLIRETPDGKQSVNEKDAELGIEEKNAAGCEQGNCCGPDAGDLGQSGKESASCGPVRTSGNATRNGISVAPDHTDVRVSEEKRSELTEESENEKGCCSGCD